MRQYENSLYGTRMAERRGSVTRRRVDKWRRSASLLDCLKPILDLHYGLKTLRAQPAVARAIWIEVGAQGVFAPVN
ncbi:MAG: hypothetical protein CTY36_13185 [Methylocystis sp.]|nr:MAG: hypothetical protein CTY36_13185 [Methylocystis sp.]